MTSNDQSLKATGVERRVPLLTEEEAEAASGFSHTSSGEPTDESQLIFVRQTDTEGAEPRKPAREAGRLTLSSPPNPKLEELWKKAEGVMGARLWQVREVMEEFGVADVAPASEEVEEELWQVVEGGEWTLQEEAADLV